MLDAEATIIGEMLVDMEFESEATATPEVTLSPLASVGGPVLTAPVLPGSVVCTGRTTPLESVTEA